MPLEATFAGSDKVENLLEDFGAPAPWAQIVLMSGAKLRNEDGKVSLTWRGFKRSIACHDIEQAKEIIAALIAADFIHGLEADQTEFSVLVTDWELWNTGRAAVRKAWARGKQPLGQAVTNGDQVETNGDKVTLEENRGDKKNNNNVEPGGIDVVRDLFAYWQERCVHTTARLTNDRRGKVQARLREGYKPEQIRKAIDGAARAPFINEAGKRFDDIELICRTGSKLEGFISRADMPAKAQNVGGVTAKGACKECGTEGDVFQGRCPTCQEGWERRVLGEDGAA